MHIDAPLISVIIPLYNKEATIKHTVTSVLQQQYQKFELLIIDDGSTDNSLNLLSDINDPRLVVISKANGGVSDARNFGVKHARGEYIFFLDADDVITSDCLSVFANMLEIYPSERIYLSNFKITSAGMDGDSFCRGNQQRFFSDPIKALWQRKIFPRTGAMLIKKTCFQEVGLFLTSITVYEDMELILRLLNRYRVVYSPAVLLSYQTEYNSLSKRPVELTREFAFYADFRNKTLFEKFILADIVYSTYRKRLEIGDKDSAKVLFRQYAKFVPILLAALIHKNATTLLYKLKII